MNIDDYIFGIEWMEHRNVPYENNCLLNADKVIKRENKIIIYFDSVKWYRWSNFEDLDTLYNFLNTIGNDRYGLLRVGEEWNDIETEADEQIAYSASVFPTSWIDLCEYGDDTYINKDNIEKELSQYRKHYIIFNDGTLGATTVKHRALVEYEKVYDALHKPTEKDDVNESRSEE
jgi:hypothetical protein